jgi:hypothetical protein
VDKTEAIAREENPIPVDILGVDHSADLLVVEHGPDV